MSGGHWEYSGGRIQLMLEQIAEDTAVRGRWPTVAAMFAGLAPVLFQIEHAMDWDLSADAGIDDDGRFERDSIGALLVAVMSVAPDAWFPRGKWATIQAVEGRIAGGHDRG